MPEDDLSESMRGPIRLRRVKHVEFPLWDAEDHLGDDPEWLYAHLGLTRPTYELLRSWQQDFDRLTAGNPSTEESAHHRRRGEILRDQVAGEVAGFEVVFEA